MGRQNLSHEIKFSGVNGDREEEKIPVQLTTSRIGNHNRLIHNLAICVTIHVYYTVSCSRGFSISRCTAFYQHAHFIPTVGVGKERRTLLGPW